MTIHCIIITTIAKNRMRKSITGNNSFACMLTLNICYLSLWQKKPNKAHVCIYIVDRGIVALPNYQFGWDKMAKWINGKHINVLLSKWMIFSGPKFKTYPMGVYPTPKKQCVHDQFFPLPNTKSCMKHWICSVYAVNYLKVSDNN